MMRSLSLTFLSILFVYSVFYTFPAFTQTLPDDIHSFRNAERSLLAKNINNRTYLDPGKLKQQRMFDVLYYRLDIEINPDSETIDGVLDITLKSEASELANIVLDLSNNLEVTAVSGAGIDTFTYG